MRIDRVANLTCAQDLVKQAGIVTGAERACMMCLGPKFGHGFLRLLSGILEPEGPGACTVAALGDFLGQFEMRGDAFFKGHFARIVSVHKASTEPVHPIRGKRILLLSTPSAQAVFGRIGRTVAAQVQFQLAREAQMWATLRPLMRQRMFEQGQERFSAEPIAEEIGDMAQKASRRRKV